MTLVLTDLGLFYCALIWGSTFYVVKDVLAFVDPITLVAYRFLLAALLLSPWVLRKNVLNHLKEGAVLAGLLAVLYASQTIGLGMTTASNSGFITGLFILFVPLFLLVFFRQSLKGLQWLGVACALAGLWILTGGLRSFNRGDVLTLLAALTYAAHLLATDRYVKKDSDTLLLAFHQFWMTGLCCLAISLLGGLSLKVATSKALGTILFLTLFPTLSAFFIQLHAQKISSPVKVAFIFSLEPVFAAIFAWTLGGEVFRPSSALGGGLIVLGMILSELSKLTLTRARKREILPI